MSTFGIIFCAYRAMDTLDAALEPWIQARATKFAGHNWLIAAVSVPFEGFQHDGEDDGTLLALDRHKNAGHIDHLITGDTPVKETEARGQALRWLVENGADVLW